MRTVAVVEAAKGILVLLVGFGLLSVAHQSMDVVAEQLTRHLYLNPAGRYPRIVLGAAGELTHTRIAMLVVAATVYATIRFIEAYGLWREARWAEWFAALSGGVYVPFELYALFREVTWVSMGALTLNLAVVGFMVYSLMRTATARVAQAT